MENYPPEFFEDTEATRKALAAGDFDKFGEILAKGDRRNGVKHATPEEIRAWVERTGGFR